MRIVILPASAHSSLAHLALYSIRCTTKIFDKVYNQNACDAGTTRVSETRCQRPLKIAKAARLPALRAGKCCAEGYSWARKRENLNPNVCDG